MVIDLVDRLADRIIQLINVRKDARRDLLEEVVTPVFTAFEAVHSAYLQSFSEYRRVIKTTSEALTSTHPLLDTIRRDNLFAEHDRAKILGLGSAAADPLLVTFVELVRNYLVDVRVASEPIGGYRGRRFANPQHWRRTLLTELDAVFHEDWQVILDQDSSGPPLGGIELEEALLAAARDADIREDDPKRLDRLKQAYAIRALDGVVEDMQESYWAISEEYARLKHLLSE